MNTDYRDWSWQWFLVGAVALTAFVHLIVLTGEPGMVVAFAVYAAYTHGMESR